MGEKRKKTGKKKTEKEKRDRFSKENDSRRGIEKTRSKEKVFQSLQVIHI